MSSVFDEEVAGQHEQSSQLAAMLERIAELQNEKKMLEAATSKVNGLLKQAESLAVEALAASGLDGVRAAGKSWFTREFFSVSVPAENREAVVEAARDAGLDDLIAVNTTTLKSWLVEQRGADGGDAGLADGTPFAGLISEYREMRLSHRTLG
jgi:dihydroorotate dehydrogenase